MTLIWIGAPFLVAALVVWGQDASMVAAGWLLLGLALGALVMPVLGTATLQRFFRETFESQGGGIAYLVIFLPFWVYTGGVTGVWSMTLGYWLFSAQEAVLALQSVALIGSLLLSLVLPGAIAALLSPALPQPGDNVVFFGTLAIANGIISAAIATSVTLWLFSLLL